MPRARSSHEQSPFPSVDGSQPRVCGEVLAGLPPRRAASPLKALGRLWAVTQAVGRVEVDKRRGNHKGQFAEKAPGFSWDSKVNRTLKAFPWMPPTAPGARDGPHEADTW